MAGNKNSGHRLDKDKMLVASLAREHTEDAIKTLVALMLTAAENSVRKSAADSILDRGWGKPAQAITGEGGKDLVIQIIKYGDNPASE